MTTCKNVHIRGLEALVKLLDERIEKNSEKSMVYYDAIRILLRHIYETEGIAVIETLNNKIDKEVVNVPQVDFLMSFLYDFDYE